MRHGNQPRLRTLTSIFVVILTVALATSACAAPPIQQKGGPDLSQFMPALQELSKLQEKLQREVQYPALRTQSKLLSQLPASTEIFFSLPNYGDVLHQSVQIFQREVKENQTLREGWQSFPMGPMVEDGLDKVYQLTQYLGNEIVVAGEVKPKGGSFVVIAEVKKPGLNTFLQDIFKQFGGAANAPIRILTPQQLLTAKPGKQPVVMLLRPDMVVISSELAAVKSFNAQLIRPGGKLAPTPFGQRLAQAYQSGAGILLGADLDRLKALVPTKTKKDTASFQQTGFADVKYLIAERKDVAGGETANDLELAFNGPRHGVASWLGAPAPNSTLDFVSPDAPLSASMVIKGLSQMFDDVLSIAKISDPNAEANLAQGEAMINLKLKDDLLNKIGNNITIALDGPIDPKGSTPPVKVIISLTDAAGFQKTLKQLLTTAMAFMQGPQQPKLEEQNEGGQTYYTLRISTGPKPTEVDYAFVDNNLVLTANRDLLSQAIRIHRDGNSLLRSSSFAGLRPPDHPGDASAVFYQNLAPLFGSVVQQMSPDLAPVLQGLLGQGKPSATFAYADDNSIHVANKSSGASDAAMAGIIAAIAIPNLLKSRKESAEVGAVATMRTLIVDQITYSNSFPEQGYSPDLASLGGGEHCTPTKEHACLADDVLACPSGTPGGWCTKGNYRFTTAATCKAGVCNEFVVVATPDDPGSQSKSFCATSDAVVRSQVGSPLTEPISAADCQTWNPN